MKRDLISVIVPVYNVEKYLGSAIESIINQTYNNLEIILIDDGSTDNSGIICDKYALIDKRIKVIHKKNEGLSSARNIGLDIASGSLIGFVDSDDTIDKSMYAELKDNMDKYNSDIAVCDYYVFDKKGRQLKHNFKEYEFVISGKEKFNNSFNEYSSLFCVAWNKLYKRCVFDNIRYPYKKVYEDAYVICNLLDKANKVSYVLKPLYNYFYYSNNLSHSFSLKQVDRIDSFDQKIMFYNQKGYNDLELREKERKMRGLVSFLSNLKRHSINNEELSLQYRFELEKLRNDIPFKYLNIESILYKLLGSLYIYLRAFGLLLRDMSLSGIKIYLKDDKKSFMHSVIRTDEV